MLRLEGVSLTACLFLGFAVFLVHELHYTATMGSTAPDDLQPWSIAVTASMTSLAFVCVCLRLLSRYERKQALWWDDYMIVFSMVGEPCMLYHIRVDH